MEISMIIETCSLSVADGSTSLWNVDRSHWWKQSDWSIEDVTSVNFKSASSFTIFCFTSCTPRLETLQRLSFCFLSALFFSRSLPRPDY